MNKVTLQGKLARDCHVSDTKTGGKMCFFTIQATREGGMDFLPVKAFEVSSAIISALVKGANVHVIGRLQSGKFDKDQKKQLFDNSVVADEIKCGGTDCPGGVLWSASAFPNPEKPAAPIDALTAAGN